MIIRKEELKQGATNTSRWICARLSSPARKNEAEEETGQMSRDEFLQRFRLARDAFRRCTVRDNIRPPFYNECEAHTLSQYRNIG